MDNDTSRSQEEQHSGNAAETSIRFRSTAAAQRAAEADAKHHKAKDTTTAKAAKHAGEVKISRDPFPVDAIVAAAIGQKHGLTIVEAEGHKGNTIILVEHVSVDGVLLHRIKKVVYQYFRTKDDAIRAARKSGIKLSLFGRSEC